MTKLGENGLVTTQHFAKIITKKAGSNIEMAAINADINYAMFVAYSTIYVLHAVRSFTITIGSAGSCDSISYRFSVVVTIPTLFPCNRHDKGKKKNGGGAPQTKPMEKPIVQCCLNSCNRRIPADRCLKCTGNILISSLLHSSAAAANALLREQSARSYPLASHLSGTVAPRLLHVWLAKYSLDLMERVMRLPPTRPPSTGS